MNAAGWSSKEIAYLRKNAHLGARAIAEDLDKTVAAVKQQAHRLRLSLRKPGSKRGRCGHGLILGEPRTGVPAEALRDFRAVRSAVIAGTFDIADAERTVRDELAGDYELCPVCVRRQVTKQSTGLCEVCHWKKLAQQMRERNEAAEARSEYRREAKKSQRMVVCDVCQETYWPRKDAEGRKSDRNVCPQCRMEAS